MIKRFAIWLVDGLICLDQAIRWWLGGWGYVWLNKERPNPDETISAWIGRHAISGNRLALTAEVVVNAIFFWRPDHCRGAYYNDPEN